MNVNLSKKQAPGKNRRGQLGDVLAHVVVRVGDNLIALAVVKATEVMIHKDRILLHIHDLEFSERSHPTSYPPFLRNDDSLWPRLVILRLPVLQIRPENLLVCEIRLKLRERNHSAVGF